MEDRELQLSECVVELRGLGDDVLEGVNGDGAEPSQSKIVNLLLQ